MQNLRIHPWWRLLESWHPWEEPHTRAGEEEEEEEEEGAAETRADGLSTTPLAQPPAQLWGGGGEFGREVEPVEEGEAGGNCFMTYFNFP